MSCTILHVLEYKKAGQDTKTRPFISLVHLNTLRYVVILNSKAINKSSHLKKYSEWNPFKTMLLDFFYFLNIFKLISGFIYAVILMRENNCENKIANNFSIFQNTNKTTHDVSCRYYFETSHINICKTQSWHL